MKIKQYPKLEGLNKVGFTAQEIERGDHFLWMDVTCPNCEKVQSVASTGSLGGPCVACGHRTDGRDMARLS